MLLGLPGVGVAVPAHPLDVVHPLTIPELSRNKETVTGEISGKKRAGTTYML